MKTLYDVSTILVVEDDILSAQKLIDQLNLLGFNEPLFASELKAAEDLPKQEHVDLALLDVKLGGGTDTIALGHTLAKQGTRVVFMSGYNPAEMAIATRGFEFIEKPISLPRLKAALQRALLRRHSATSAVGIDNHP